MAEDDNSKKEEKVKKTENTQEKTLENNQKVQEKIPKMERKKEKNMDTKIKQENKEIRKQKDKKKILTSLGAVLVSACCFVGVLGVVNNINKKDSNSENKKSSVEEAILNKKELVKATKPYKLSNVTEDDVGRCLDPIAKDYIKENIDKAYADFDKFEVKNVMIVKNTIVDESKMLGYDTIDSFFSTHDTDEAFISSVPTGVALYNTDDDSEWLVAYANTMQDSENATALDAVFAKSSNEGETITDAYFDKETGLAYMKKSYFENEKGEQVLEACQMQILQACKDIVTPKANVTYLKIDGQQEGLLNKNIDLSKKTNKTVIGNGNINSFTFQTVILADKGMDTENMSIYVNGVPLGDDQYDYDKETGKILIGMSACGIQNVIVDVNSVLSKESLEGKNTKSTLAKATDKLSDAVFKDAEVHAVSASAMECAGTVTVPSGVGAGYSANHNLYVGYRSNAKSGGAPVYTYGTSYATSFNNVIQNGGLNYNSLSKATGNMFLGIYLVGGKEVKSNGTTVNHNSFWGYTSEGAASSGWGWDFGAGGYVGMQCAHITTAQGTGTEWKDQDVKVRVFDKTNDYVIVGFSTKKINSQTGHGILKFKVRQTKYTLSIAFDSGVQSVSGAGTYDANAKANVTYYLKPGYHIVRIEGTKTNGESGGVWTGSANKEGTVSGTWTITCNRSIKIITAKNTYTNVIWHWAIGFTKNDGNNEAKNCYHLKTTSFNKTYQASGSFSTADGINAPNGFKIANRMSSPDISGSWASYTLPYSYTQPAKNISTEFYYEPITYSISYNMNGGTNNNSNPTSYNVLYGVTLKDPTRTGYIFSGWYNGNTKVTGINPDKNATFSSADDLYNQLASRTTGNITLTARWTPIQYTFVFNGLAPNTTTNKISGSMSNQTFDYDTRADLKKNTYTLPNHKFIGWSTSSGNNLNKDNITYKDGDSIYNLTTVNGTVYNLYTVWDEMPKISTKYRKYLKDKDVSLEELIKYVKVSDKEDGDLTSSAKIKQIQYSDRIDTNPTKLDTSVAENEIVVTMTVTDSAGSTVEANFIVTIYEEKPEIIAPSDKEKIRFVGNYESKRYYLKADSNWATDRILNQKLKDSFANTNTGNGYVYNKTTKRWEKQ